MLFKRFTCFGSPVESVLNIFRGQELRILMNKILFDIANLEAAFFVNRLENHFSWSGKKFLILKND